MNPMLSIIIPTHNRLSFLKELFCSIKNQNYKNIEVIIVADACTDGTNEYLEQQELLETWRYFINETSLNAGGSRRRGFLESSGEYVTFIDDDDYLIDCDFYTRAVNIFEKYVNLSVVASNSINKYEQSGVFEKTKTNIDGYIDGMTYMSGFQFKWFKPNPSFAVFRRSKLIEAGIYNMYMVNDCPLYMRSLLVGDIFIEREPVGVYRIHETNISKSISSDFIIENLKEKNYIYKELKRRSVNYSLSFWWYKTVRLTFDYFMTSCNSKLEAYKVKLWCLRHFNNSIKLMLYVLYR